MFWADGLIPYGMRRHLYHPNGVSKVSVNQSTHLFEYNSHSGWLQETNTRKFDIKIIKNNQIMANSFHHHHHHVCLLHIKYKHQKTSYRQVSYVRQRINDL